MLETLILFFLAIIAWIAFSKLRGSSRTNARAGGGAPSSHGTADSYRAAVIQSANRLVVVVNESLKLAKDSQNAETKLSRLEVAKNRLNELEKLAAKHPYIELTTLNAVKRSISTLESEFERSMYRQSSEGNMRGQALEKSGEVEEAIAEYEKLLATPVDTPHTYRRLAILYARRKQPDDELRVLKAAIRNIPSANNTHYQWFAERLAKRK